MALTFAWIFFHVTTPQEDFSYAAVEGVLIGANIDPDKSVVKKIDADGHHWKIDVSSHEKKDAVIKALNKMAQVFDGQFNDLQKKYVAGKQHHLVTVEVGENPKLSLLFVVASQKGRTRRAEMESLEQPSARTVEEGAPSKIAIVLDDVGGHPVEHLTQILDLRFPITFSVIPYLGYSTKNAIFLHQNHYQVMLHLPMEPFDYPKRDPGPGGVMCYMNDQEIVGVIDRALHNVPFAVGMNNHMGSKVTANRTLMTSILRELKRRDLFFVDSRTHDSTVAFETAQSMGLRAGERRVFLDSERTYEFSVKQLELACEKADAEGQVIVIGHPYPTTLEALVARMPEIDQQGYQFVFVDDLLRVTQEHL